MAPTISDDFQESSDKFNLHIFENKRSLHRALMKNNNNNKKGYMNMLESLKLHGMACGGTTSHAVPPRGGTVTLLPQGREDKSAAR